MQVISQIGESSKIEFFKKMIEMRTTPNYHFMPEWALEQNLNMGDAIMILAFLLKADWGTWGPNGDGHLVQRFEYDNKRVKYQIVLTKDNRGACTIYMSASHNAILPRKFTLYVATNAYYREMCNEAIDEKYEFVNPMYHENGVVGKWHQSLADAISQ